MDSGMLWFDNGKDSLETKLERAFNYFKAKYGYEPDTCLVPFKLDLTGFTFPKLSIRKDRYIFQGHFLIGCDDRETKNKPS